MNTTHYNQKNKFNNNNLPEKSSSNSLFDFLLKNRHIKTTQGTDCRLSAMDILYNEHAELSYLAAECGIDWDKALPYVNHYSTTIKNNIHLEPKYKGKVTIWVNIKTTHNGQEYPVVHFSTFKHGGINNTFNGFHYLPKQTEFFPTKRKDKQPLTELVTNNAEAQADQDVFQKANEDKYKINRFNQFHRYFQTLEIATESPYLERKHISFKDIPDSFTIKRGYDDRGQYIAYALQNNKNKVVGYQKIYDKPFYDTRNEVFRDKDYIFLPNSKNGSYALIGDISENSNQVDIGEGLATVLSCYIQTGKISAIALDNHNLKHVCEVFKSINIRILADNDIKDSKTNEGNVGLFSALKLAHTYGASVVYPELNDKKCDFNDVLVEQGADELKKQLASNKIFKNLTHFEYYCYSVKLAPQQQFSKALNKACYYIAQNIATVKQFKQMSTQLIIYTESRTVSKQHIRQTIKRMFKNYVLADIYKRHAVTKIEGIGYIDMSDKTNQEIAAHIINENKIYVDVRGMGSGKTEVMYIVSEYIKNNSDKGDSQIVYVCPRVSLASGGAKRLGLDYYKDINVNFGQYSEQLSVCVNSIPSHNIVKTKLLLLDEFRQMLEFISIGSVENRIKVQETLIEAINNADTVILADADFNDFSLKWLKENTNKSIEVIQADNMEHNKNITVFQDNESIIDDANDQLRNNHNIWITSDSKIQVNKTFIGLEELAKEMGELLSIEPNETLIITGDNKGDPRQKKFLENPQEESKKYRLIISTPVISSGISITHNHFDVVYGLFSNVIPANEMLQSIGRIRTVKDIRVAFKKGHKKTRETDVNKLIDGEDLKNSRIVDGHILDIHPMAFQRAEITSNTNKSLNNFRQEFLILAQIKGYSIMDNQHIHKIKGLATLTLEKEVERIYNAQPVTREEGLKLKRNIPDNQSERDSLDKFLVEEMSGNTDHSITKDDIKFYKQQGLQAIQNYELIHASMVTTQAIEYDEYKRTQGETNGISSRALFMKGIIEKFEDRSFNHFDINDEMDYLRANHAELNINRLGNFRDVRRPIIKLKNLLIKMGYSLEQVGRENAVRGYKIVENKQVVTYVENRLKAKIEYSAAMNSFI